MEPTNLALANTITHCQERSRCKRKRPELDDGFVDESVDQAPNVFRLAKSFRRASNQDAGTTSSPIKKKKEEVTESYYESSDDASNSSEHVVDYDEIIGSVDARNRKNANETFDPVCFFSSPTFPQEQLNQAYKRVTDALQDPLSRLEDGGVHKYLEHLNQRELRKSRKEMNESERIRSVLQDATIRGDPREYQRVLFEVAKSSNTIINLGTGFGKTLVALMCIQHFSSSFGEGKQTLFLVPSVALAIQQSITLRANLPKYDVRTACYTSANSDSARKALASSHVIVATHGAILDLMMHYADMFEMRRFNLLVVDECHYATGNHAYSVIMNKFYHVLPPDERPHVLGLTASPLVNVKETHSDEQLDEMLYNLERTLDARLVSASGLMSESTPELMTKMAEERVVSYRGTNVGRAIPSADNLDLHQCRYREFKQLDQLYKDLGPLVVGIYCGTLGRELSRNDFENETSYQFKEALRLLSSIEYFCKQECTSNPDLSRTDKLLALENLLEVEIEDQGDADTVGLVFVERRITAMALHNYFLHRSREIERGTWEMAKRRRRFADLGGSLLSSNYCNQSQFDDSVDDPFAIFQISQEQTGNININKTTDSNCSPDLPLEDQFMDAEDDILVSSHDLPREISEEPKNSIRSSAIVRNSTQIFKSLCVSRKSFSEQEKEGILVRWIHQETNVRDMLTKLRKGEVNLLFATSVVEEGVDVQACSFVVVFDALKNTKSYIQMKGRARQRSAKFFVFHDKDDTSGAFLPLKVAQDMERRIQQFIERKSKSRLPQIIPRSVTSTENLASEGVANELAALKAGCYAVSNGRVDVHSAKSLLNRYALSVPLDPFCRNSKESLFAHLPCFGVENLILPSHLPSSVRTVQLPEQYQHLPKKERQKLLSLVACVRLHSLGLLNDRLLPLTRKDMQKQILRVATRDHRAVPFSLPPSEKFFGSSTFQAYMYPIKQTSVFFSGIQGALLGEGHELALICLERIGMSIPPTNLRHPEFGIITVSLGGASTVICTKEERSILSRIFLLLMNERWSRRSRNMSFCMKGREAFLGTIPPYFVGITSKLGHLDWEFMEMLLAEASRSKEDRIKAVQFNLTSSPLRRPRLWAPQYDEAVSYVVYGPSGETCAAPFPHQKEGVLCYQDYFAKYRKFDVNKDSPLFDAQRMWSRPSSVQFSDEKDATKATPATKTENARYSVCKYLASVKLAQEACIEPPLANAHVALLCCVLPQCLYVYERFMNTKAFIEHCCANFRSLGPCLEKLDIADVATVLTAKSCSLDVNYEKLEWFGDSVLKLVQTDSLIKSGELRNWIQFLHEGDLSTLRSAMGSNDRLEKICKQLRLDKFIMVSPLARGQWIPQCMKFCEGTKLFSNDPVGSKVYADIIEALLGLLYLKFGYEKVLEAADDLHLTLSRTEVFLERSPQYKPNRVLLDAIKLCTGYRKFKAPELAEEAFTHPSANHPGVSSYQRLEWIGDAVLCLYMREWIFKEFFALPLGEMVVFEAALVSNETLAFLCVRNGLQHFLQHNDHSLPSRIESYCWNVQEQGSGLWGADPPKTISDIVESVIGAVYVDGGFVNGQNAVKNIMSPLLDILLRSRNRKKEVYLKHPKKILHEIGGDILELGCFLEADFASLEPNADVSVGVKWVKASPDGCHFVATVEMFGSVILAVSDSSAVVARNKACALVIDVLQKNHELRARLHSCRARIEKELFLVNRPMDKNDSDTE